MKTPLWIIGFMAAAILLSACGEMIPAPTMTPVFLPASTATPDVPSAIQPSPANPIQATPALTPIADYPTAVQNAIKALSAKLSIDADQITVLSYEDVQWPNGCLGIQKAGMMCTDMIVEGYRVLLQVKSTRYEYRTNLNGGAVELNPNAWPSTNLPGGKNLPNSNTATLSYHVEGGIAGLCEDLSISADGKATAYSCVGGSPVLLGESGLSVSELDQLHQWVSQYKKFEAGTQDPPVPDAMSTRLVFNGSGTQVPQDSDKQAIIKFAGDLFNRISNRG